LTEGIYGKFLDAFCLKLF